MMQKKVISLALAAGLVAPLAAFADSANVTFYGVLDADAEQVKTDKPVAPTATAGASSRGRITSNASRFGLKGSDDLGNGLQAIYQVESRVALNGNDGGSGVFSGLRNTNLGLTGGFGTVFVGNWDTPFKTAHNKVELFDNSSIATATALLGNNQGANTFNLRQNSSVQYWSPVMSGFQIKGDYSFVNAIAGSAAATPSLLSLSAAYDNGPIYVALANEQHRDYTITNTAATTIVAAATTPALFTGQKDSATRLIGAYTVDAFQVGLTYETFTINNGAGVSNKRNAYALSGKYNLGASNLGASYTKAGDMGATVNSGAKQISLRYGYTMSKRTELYAMYTQISNNAAGAYNFTDVAGVSTLTGAKLSGFGAGLRHTF
jgi:predicted porin